MANACGVCQEAGYHAGEILRLSDFMKLDKDHRVFFLAFLTLVSLAFLAILMPFYNALMWAAILAMLFSPMERRLLARMPNSRNAATLITMGAVVLMVIIPVIFLTGSLVTEGAQIYDLIRSGKVNFGAYFGQIMEGLPVWLRQILEQQGLLDLPSIQQRLSESGSEIGQYVASQAVSIGQNTARMLASAGILLYVLFFLLRDGGELMAIFRKAIPMEDEQKNHLLVKFSTVVKATVKGNIAIAAMQGVLGGFIVWVLGFQGALLWGVVMAFLSLVPAVGSGLVWGPMAIYLMATGAVGKGVLLMAYGVGVIGLVDNLMRPLLVGKDTKMPDYLVLVSTIGGMSLFGLNGFVIGPLIAALFMASWDLYVSPEKVRAEKLDEEAEAAAAAVAAATAAAQGHGMMERAEQWLTDAAAAVTGWSPSPNGDRTAGGAAPSTSATERRPSPNGDRTAEGSAAAHAAEKGAHESAGTSAKGGAKRGR